MSTEIDFYALLEVERTADADELKSAYRRLAIKYHPDKNQGCGDSEAKFRAVNEAYDCLKDPRKRAAYDRFRPCRLQAGRDGQRRRRRLRRCGLRRFFRYFRYDLRLRLSPGRGRGQQQRRGADLRYDMEITLEEAFHGKETSIAIDVSTKCDACDGRGAEPGTSVDTVLDLCRPRQGARAAGFLRGRAHLPELSWRGRAYQDALSRLSGRRARRQGAQARRQGAARRGRRHAHPSGRAGRSRPARRGGGRSLIFLHVKRHAMFERDGVNIFCRVPISFTLAALGGSIEVPGLDGNTHEISHPRRYPVGQAGAPAGPACRS